MTDMTYVAMCLWEEIVTSDGPWDANREQDGTCAMRDTVASFAKECAAYHDQIDPYYNWTFDWEWCPVFLRHCVDWDASCPYVLPLDQCRKAAHKALHGDR